ncbi:MAG: 3-coathanger stack domain-containing protein, partial [Saprospiraceae bacterium]
AQSINLLYSDFWLPTGATFYIYNQDYSHVIGGFTEKNNRGVREDKQAYATGLVRGDQITLEYYEPFAVAGMGEISIRSVVHGYRYTNPYGDFPVKAFGDSGPCNVNINCNAGNSWQDEKLSVALVMVEGVRWCSGALVNTRANEFVPYFLTANHCLCNDFSYPNGIRTCVDNLDAINNPDADNWVFYFDYETDNCANPAADPIANATSYSGARLVANQAQTDFALFRITANQLAGGEVYAGWDPTGAAVTSATGIHHPRGDVMKIAVENNAPTTSSYGSGTNSHWRINNWDIGVTEPGSSGSPLFDQNSRIVGQLHGGTAACNGNTDNAGHDNYGKLSISWNGISTNDRRRRLSDWIGQTCSTDLVISTGQSGEKPVFRSNTINASSQIASNAFVHLEGTDYVDLEPGFDAFAGSDFTARIGTGCTGNLDDDGSNGKRYNLLVMDSEKVDGTIEPNQKSEFKLRSDMPTEKVMSIATLSVAPNPVQTRAQVTFATPKADVISATLTNTFGQVVHTFTTQQAVEEGITTFELQAANLPSGVYHVNVMTPIDTYSRAVIVAGH